jgi:hypothetical protein
VNRQAFSETADILVVFEDDVYATVPDIKTAMVAEIENMESDIKYLGWCMWNDHNMVRFLDRPVPVPVCFPMSCAWRRHHLPRCDLMPMF